MNYDFDGAAAYLALSVTTFRQLVAAGHVRAYRYPHVAKDVFPVEELDRYRLTAAPVIKRHGKKNESRGNLRTVKFGELELLYTDRETEDQGQTGADEIRSVPQPPKPPRKREKRCAPGKRRFTYELG